MGNLTKVDPVVDQVIQRIAKAVRPERIILFGSRARGESRNDSDIDLVIVYQGPRSKREIQLEIHRLFPHPDFSLDVFALTVEELEKGKKITNTLAHEVSERGVVCYQ